MAHYLSRGMRAAAAILLMALAVLTLATTAQASCWPPAEGDWIIEAVEDCLVENQDFTLPGDLLIYGHLTLNNCILRFAPTAWADKGIWVYGDLDATDSRFASTNTEVPFYLGAHSAPETENTFAGCTLDNVDVELAEQSHNTFNDSATASTLFAGCSDESRVYCPGYSHNTFTNVTFQHNASAAWS